MHWKGEVCMSLWGRVLLKNGNYIFVLNVGQYINQRFFW
jgi:hypothetical protein